MSISSPQQLAKIQKECGSALDQHPKRVIVCCGTGCLANGAAGIVEAFHKTLKEKKVKGFTVEAVKETRSFLTS